MRQHCIIRIGSGFLYILFFVCGGKFRVFLLTYNKLIHTREMYSRYVGMYYLLIYLVNMWTSSLLSREYVTAANSEFRQ